VVITKAEKAASAARRAKNRAHGELRTHERVRARPIRKGERVKITRSCLEQRMFLTVGQEPEEIVNYYGYTLGLSLRDYRVDLHAATQMGNHHHVDVTDVHGTRVGFKNSLHGNLARGLNARRGRFENFWATGGSCDTCEPTDEESLDGLAYTDANAVISGLVRWSHEWPGFSTYGWRFGETRTFKRPDWYRDPNNPKNPDEVQITRIRPKIFMELSDDELFDKLMERIHERELKAHRDMAKANRRFKGVKKILKQKWHLAPTPRAERFRVKPKVVASSWWRLLAQLQRDRAWEAEYAAARATHLRREDALFPYGTYRLRQLSNVRVAQAPP
jgi:hypothetical protein